VNRETNEWWLTILNGVHNHKMMPHLPELGMID